MESIFDEGLGGHDPRLLLLAFAISLSGGFTGAYACAHARGAAGLSQKIWFVCGAFALGSAIFAAHLIADMAYRPILRFGYDALGLFLSLSLAVGICGGGAVFALGSNTALRRMLGGSIAGLGAAATYFFGMQALEVPGRLAWDSRLAVASTVLGIAFFVSAAAVRISQSVWMTCLASALLVSAGVAAQHLVAMEALAIYPDGDRDVSLLTMPAGFIAIVIANATAAILGLCLVAVLADSHSRQREGIVSTALENLAQGLVMFDSKRRLVLFNRRYLEVYELPPGSVRRGMSHRALVELRRETGASLGDPEEHCRSYEARIREQRPWSLVHQFSDGRRASQSNHRPLPDGGWISTHEDITDRLEAEQKIEFLAHNDVMTGLPNRTTLLRVLSDLIGAAARSEAIFALICLDLDHFKEINDTFGHTIGDRYLVALASRLKASAASEFLARTGGDELMLIVTEPDTLTNLTSYIDRVKSSVSQPVQIEGNRLQSTVTAGVATFPLHGADRETLVKHADAALYRAKQNGRGSTAFFDAELSIDLLRRRIMREDLRHALAQDHLQLHYQPQVSRDGTVVGFEALARWQHQSNGNIPPAAFIPIAEESGLILPLGEWALRSACREAASWEKKLSVAVNISPAQFKHGDLVSFVAGTLRETGLDPGRLELELTEGVMISDPERALRIMQDLRQLGVMLALDDFGTGYASLSYLQELPFTAFKTDKRFLQRLGGRADAAVVRALAELGCALNLSVVAEGVETKEQLRFLTEVGCDRFQGFLIGRPQPISEHREHISCLRPSSKAAS